MRDQSIRKSIEKSKLDQSNESNKTKIVEAVNTGCTNYKRNFLKKHQSIFFAKKA